MLRIGLDIGGTKTELVALDAEGHERLRRRERRARRRAPLGRSARLERFQTRGRRAKEITAAWEPRDHRTATNQAFSATSTSSSIFFASPNSMRLLSL